MILSRSERLANSWFWETNISTEKAAHQHLIPRWGAAGSLWRHQTKADRKVCEDIILLRISVWLVVSQFSQPSAGVSQQQERTSMGHSIYLPTTPCWQSTIYNTGGGRWPPHLPIICATTKQYYAVFFSWDFVCMKIVVEEFIKSQIIKAAGRRHFHADIIRIW